MVDFSLMMNGPVKDIAMNILCDVLTDVVYWGYHQARGLKNKKSQEIQEVTTRLLGLLDKYKDTAVDSGCFSEYIQLPQINDLLKDYVYYTAVDTKAVFNSKIDNLELLDYLVINAIEYCANSIKEIDKNIVSEFFMDFFNLSRKYYYDNLSISQKSIVFFVNEKLEKLEKIILSSINYKVEINPDFNIVAEEYKRFLKRNNNMCLIYGFAEVKISQCYVLPDLIGHRGMEKIEFESQGTKHEIEIPSIEEIAWNNIFEKNNIVYLIGGAGYGKSLYLQYLINYYDQLNIKNINEFIVLYCDLKTYYNNKNKHPYPIVNFLADSAIESTGLGEDKIKPEFINYYLNSGRCIILFDALDEVPKHQRAKLHNLITSFFVENNLNNKICITSRARGFFPKHEIEVYEIAELNRTQIMTYLNKMVSLKFFKKDDIPLFLQQADDLQDKKFLNSFLLLSLLVNIFKAEKKLPQTKVDLYRKCFDYMAKDREMTKSEFDEKYDWKKISNLMKDSTFIELACLAAPNNANIKENQIIDRLSHLYEKKYGCYVNAEDAVIKFLSFCSERTELFVPATEDKTYKFFHRSFFEYFYARYICTNFFTATKIYKEFLKFDIDTEIYELTVSIIKNDKEELYQDLVEYIFKRVNESLSKAKTSYKDINILVSVLQTVDEKFYKIKFSKLFLEYFDTLCSDNLCIRDEYALQIILDEALMEDQELLEMYIDKCEYRIFLQITIRLLSIVSLNESYIADKFFYATPRPFILPLEREIRPFQVLFNHPKFVNDFIKFIGTINKDTIIKEYSFVENIDKVVLYLKSKSEEDWKCFISNLA